MTKKIECDGCNRTYYDEYAVGIEMRYDHPYGTKTEHFCNFDCLEKRVKEIKKGIKEIEKEDDEGGPN